jgi:hypothetical protein
MEVGRNRSSVKYDAALPAFEAVVPVVSFH